MADGGRARDGHGSSGLPVLALIPEDQAPPDRKPSIGPEALIERTAPGCIRPPKGQQRSVDRVDVAGRRVVEPAQVAGAQAPAAGDGDHRVVEGLDQRTHHVARRFDGPTEDERQEVTAALVPFQEQGILFHAIRSRIAGTRRFVSMHVLMPGTWTIQRGHDVSEAIEAAVREKLPGAHVFTHLEPREDPVSWEDRGLDRR